MKVDFTVYGNPQGKGRPRFARRGSYVHTYTPEKTVAYEEEIQTAYLRQCENYFGYAPLNYYVTAYYPNTQNPQRKGNGWKSTRGE